MSWSQCSGVASGEKEEGERVPPTELFFRDTMDDAEKQGE